MISEFQPNPEGGDPATVQFELSGTAGASFDLWILSIESDGTSGIVGTVDRAANVMGTYDSNGLAVVDIPDLENPSFTVLLTDSFGGAIGDDLDTDDDGFFDTTPWGVLMDAIGVPDTTGETLYGANAGFVDFAFTGSEPILTFREATTGQWIAVNPDLSIIGADGTVYSAADFDVDPTAGPTFGSVNPAFVNAIPEPSTNIACLAVLGMAIFGAAVVRRKEDAIV